MLFSSGRCDIGEASHFLYTYMNSPIPTQSLQSIDHNINLDCLVITPISSPITQSSSISSCPDLQLVSRRPCCNPPSTGGCQVSCWHFFYSSLRLTGCIDRLKSLVFQVGTEKRGRFGKYAIGPLTCVLCLLASELAFYHHDIRAELIRSARRYGVDNRPKEYRQTLPMFIACPAADLSRAPNGKGQRAR